MSLWQVKGYGAIRNLGAWCHVSVLLWQFVSPAMWCNLKTGWLRQKLTHSFSRKVSEQILRGNFSFWQPDINILMSVKTSNYLTARFDLKLFSCLRLSASHLELLVLLPHLLHPGKKKTNVLVALYFLPYPVKRRRHKNLTAVTVTFKSQYRNLKGNQWLLDCWLQTLVFKGTVHPKHQKRHIPVWSLKVNYLHQRKASSQNNYKNTKYITDTEDAGYLVSMQSSSHQEHIGPQINENRFWTHQISGVCVGALLFFFVFKTLFFDQITFLMYFHVLMYLLN